MYGRPRQVVRAAVCVLLLVAVSACARASHPASLSQRSTAPAASSVPAPRPSPTGLPHFSTPAAAMRYLAAAWNTGDLVSLKHVTNPAARDQLNAMHAEATNLRLTACIPRPQGDYTCTFAHDYPPGYHPVAGSTGPAVFLVGPALTPAGT